MKKFRCFGAAAMFTLAAAAAPAATDQSTLVVTASNATNNQLLVYNSTGQMLQAVGTQGKGGVSGNAGGVVARGGMVAVVNFGSQNVSIFERRGNGMQMHDLIPAASSPVSVAFGESHLYILGTTKVESHRIYGDTYVSSAPDGVVTLLKADASAAQVGVVANQLIITEKSNTIETVNLMPDGSVGGTPTLVLNIPSNVDAPFGLVTRGNNAYVTIAHADEVSLVRNSKVLTVTGSGTEHSPCWATLVGPFLYTANSPSKSVSRFAVYGQKIVQDLAVAAQFAGNPTDIDSGGGLVAVIDSAGTLTRLSVFDVDEDGNLTQRGIATINAVTNGVAVVRSGR